MEEDQAYVAEAWGIFTVAIETEPGVVVSVTGQMSGDPDDPMAVRFNTFTAYDALLYWVLDKSTENEVRALSRKLLLTKIERGL